jgi:TonB family protein
VNLDRGHRLGDWVVDRPLGAGGMGSVFRCHSVLADDVLAAVKVLEVSDFGDYEKRFVQELRTLASLSHPAIVKVHGGGRDEEHRLVYLAMELVEGEDLEHVLQKGPLAAEQALSIFGPVADALRYTHEKGVAHRDIKPANIMIRADGTPVIVDFGIAVAKGHTRLTREGMVPGTVAYLPPEIFQGDPPNAKSTDAYALGVVMWESLTGTPAFMGDPDSSDGEQMAQVLGKKLRGDALDPGNVVPEPLREAILRTTDPEPDTRLIDLAEVSALLAEATGEQALPAGRRRRYRPRRRSLASRLFAVVAVLALVGMGALSMGLLAVVLGLLFWGPDGSEGPARPPVNLAETLEKGAFALERGDLGDAYKHAGLALDDHPEDPYANLLYGQVLLKRGDLLLARPYLCGAVDGGLRAEVPAEVACARGSGAAVPLTAPLVAARVDLGAEIAASTGLLGELAAEEAAVADAAADTGMAPPAKSASRSRASRPAPAPSYAPAPIASAPSEPEPPPPPGAAPPAPPRMAEAEPEPEYEFDDDIADLFTIGSGSPEGGSIGGAGTDRAGAGSGAPTASAPAPAPTSAKVSTGSTEVTGTLSREDIERVIRRNIARIRACYEGELANTPGLSGRLVIRFVIGANGTVTTAAVEESTLNNAAMEACVVAQFRRMRFPAPEGGGVVTVTYPLVFTAQ